MHRSPLLLTALAVTASLGSVAQTTTHHTASTTHRPSSTAHKSASAAGPLCATLPPISDKIPALPTSAGCPKVLFTVSDRLDYLAPVAQRFKTTLFSELPVVISLGYAEIKAGTGEAALPQHWYTVKYTGWLPDGTKFDSSEDHEETKTLGFTFPYGAHRVIAGWDLGFEGMRIGGKRRLYIPYQFAYGAGGQPPKIPPKSMLIFDMELIAQSDHPPAPPTPPPAPSTPAAPSGAPGAPVTVPPTAKPGISAPAVTPDTNTAPPAGAPPVTPPPATKPQPPTP